MEHTGYENNNIHQSLKVAEMFGISQQDACNARRRYLSAMLDKVDDRLADYNSYKTDCDENAYYRQRRIYDLVVKRKKIYAELEQIKRITMPRNEITDEMIQRAREYPVEKLVEFSRGKKATAWCHPDKNPSMYHMTRINKVNCPVCDKSFDSIAILRDRDGMTFRDAVLNLCSW